MEPNNDSSAMVNPYDANVQITYNPYEIEQVSENETNVNDYNQPSNVTQPPVNPYYSYNESFIPATLDDQKEQELEKQRALEAANPVSTNIPADNVVNVPRVHTPPPAATEDDDMLQDQREEPIEPSPFNNCFCHFLGYALTFMFPIAGIFIYLLSKNTQPTYAQRVFDVAVVSIFLWCFVVFS